MKTITIENGDVEVTVQLTQNKEEIILGTTDGGNNYLKPLETVELAKMLIAGAMQCIDFPESHAVTCDLRKFIEGHLVDPDRMYTDEP